MIGIAEANPLLSTAELDAVRDLACNLVQQPFNTAIQNEAAFRPGPTVDYTRKRDPRADSLVLLSLKPYQGVRIALVGEWLDASPEQRKALVLAAAARAAEFSSKKESYKG